MRTQIQILAYTEVTDDDGYKSQSWDNVFGENVFVRCHWSNAHGQEVLTAESLGLKETATLTMRYTDKVTPTCCILCGNDPMPYEITSVDNVLNLCRFLEVKVHRRVAST